MFLSASACHGVDTQRWVIKCGPTHGIKTRTPLSPCREQARSKVAVVATFRLTWGVFKTTAIPHQTNYKGTSGNRTRANMFSDIPQQTECTARVEKPELEETRL